MTDFLRKIDSILTTKRVSISLILLNLTSIICGILFIAIRGYNVFWDIFGVILLITLFGNLLMVYLNSLRINRNTTMGSFINILCYLYLIILILGMLWIVYGNYTITSSSSNDVPAAYRNINIGYFGPLIFAIVICFLNLKGLKNEAVWDPSNKTGRTTERPFKSYRKAFRIILGLIAFLWIILGIHFASITVMGNFLGLQSPETYGNELTYAALFGGYHGIMGMFVAVFALSWAFIFLSFTILLLKTFNRAKSPKRYKAFGLIGIILTGIFMLPLLLTPYSYYAADQNFTDAFGADWRDNIPEKIESKYFLESPFSTPYYFLGFPPKECDIDKNIKFYEDEDIELYFDVYSVDDAKDLPGEASVLIWIHGGGWSLGDKGNYRIQLNKYFAAQGYIVFDIQYGLYADGSDRYSGALSPPKNVQGDFDIDDMVKHIGIFTNYLVNHSDKYDVDLDSVFISGGSAGGHLASVTALAIASGDYKDIFPSDNMTIKGYVPYYPGNRLPVLTGLDGKKEFIDPAKLIDKKSPPCLIFEGTGDGLVHYSIVEDFKAAYDDENNDECAILYAPLGGHAADIYFNGYYNMVFLYYMERFLYLCVNDKIE